MIPTFPAIGDFLHDYNQQGRFPSTGGFLVKTVERPPCYGIYFASTGKTVRCFVSLIASQNVIALKISLDARLQAG